MVNNVIYIHLYRSFFIFQSKARIEESIKRVAKKKYKEDPPTGEKFISEALGRLGIATKADDALRTADLVVEAVSLIYIQQSHPAC